MQCTFFEGGVRRFVVKGSRAYLRATDIYIHWYNYVYSCCVYSLGPHGYSIRTK